MMVNLQSYCTLSFASISVLIHAIEGPSGEIDEVDITRLPGLRRIGTLSPWRARLMGTCDSIGCAVSWIRPLARFIWDFGDRLDNRESEETDFIPGLADYGAIRMVTDKPDDIDGVFRLFASQETISMKVALTDSPPSIITFPAYIKEFSVADDKMSLSVRVCGSPTFRDHS